MRIEALTPMEEQSYLHLVGNQKNDVSQEAENIRTSRILEEAPRLAERMNLPLSEAVEVMKSRAAGNLLTGDMVQFQTLGSVLVADILSDPAKYDKQACSDPSEPEEGTSRAKFFANVDSGTPLVHSMLHGGSKYYLQHDTTVIPTGYTAPAPVRKSKDEVIAELATMMSKGKVSPEQWCKVLSSGNLGRVDLDVVLDFLASTMQIKKTTLKNEFQEYLSQIDTCKCFDRLQNLADGRVILQYVPYKLNEATEQAEQAMLSVQGKWPYFCYGNVLSYSTYDSLTKSSTGIDDEPPPLVPVIKPYTRDNLCLRIEQSTLHFMVKKNNGIEKKIPVPTPQAIVNKLIEHPSPLAPKVSGLVSHPVLAKDGRVIDKEGIDDATGLLLQFGGSSFHPVPAHITREDAHDAANRIFKNLFSEFCFKNSPVQEGLYATTALAMLQTGILRKVIDQAPGFLVVANVQGSGKTTLSRQVHAILTGKDMPVSSLGGSTEEMKKEMLAMFMQSPAMVCYDNILDGSELNDPILAKAITSPEFKGRILGKTQEATVPTNTVIAITGNNVTLGADLVRRFVTVSLTADIAQPENRVYKHPDIVQHCLNNRRDIIRDSLLITKAYIDAGCPIDPATVGSSGFIQWDRMVRLPLLWATGIDVLHSMNENRKQSSEHLAMVRVLHNLEEIFPGQSFTASRVMAVIQNGTGNENEIVDSLIEGLANMSARSLSSIKSLAWVLKKLEGRIVDGMVLEREQIRNRADEFRVRRMQDKPMK